MSLRKELEALKEGESLVTAQARTAAYVAAQRAGLTITTKDVGEGKTEVTVTGKLAEAVPDIPEKSVLGRLKDLSRKERLTIFEEFELCCGMGRGQCICTPEEVVEVPDATPQRMSVAELKAMLGQAEDRVGIAEPVSASTVMDDWRFKDISAQNPVEWNDDGNCYRRQYLWPLGKRTRRVQVDCEKPDTVLRIV